MTKDIEGYRNWLTCLNQPHNLAKINKVGCEMKKNIGTITVKLPLNSANC